MRSTCQPLRSSGVRRASSIRAVGVVNWVLCVCSGVCGIVMSISPVSGGRLARCPYLTGGLNGCQATMRSVASPHCRRLTPLGLPVTCSAGCTAVRWADVSAVWPARATRPVARSGTGGLCLARPVPAGAPDRRVAVEHRPQLAGRVPQMRRQGIKAHVECRVRRGAMLRLGGTWQCPPSTRWPCRHRLNQQLGMTAPSKTVIVEVRLNAWRLHGILKCQQSNYQ